MSKPRLNYPELSVEPFKALFALSRTTQGSSIDRATTDLVHLRVSQLNGCLFCLDMHSKEAKIHGERELRLHHLALWHESPLFSEKEKAALEWAEILTKFPPHGVSDEAFAKVRAHYSEKEVSDLTFIIAIINTWNRLGVAFRNEPGAMDKMMGLEKAGLS